MTTFLVFAKHYNIYTYPQLSTKKEKSSKKERNAATASFFLKELKEQVKPVTSKG